MKVKKIHFIILAIVPVFIFFSCISPDKITEDIPSYTYGIPSKGTEITLKFAKGKEHNHPLFAIWLADSAGNYIQTLYVSESIGKGVFKRADRKTGAWQSGEIQRPAALPYWVHQRNVINELGTLLPTAAKPLVDAYSGSTPLASFTMELKTDTPLNGSYKLFLELNQSWDWNEYWTNDKYPNDKEYKTSSQPALIYMADFNTSNKNKEIEMKPVGRSHYSGNDGKLYEDLKTLTTALKIAKKITIQVK
ncbi:MAG: hypothetical protein ACYC2P_04680 [Paludibacteraceae bacterium]